MKGEAKKRYCTVNAGYNDSSCNDIRPITIRYACKPDLLCKITIFSVLRYRKINDRTHRQIVISRFYSQRLLSPTTLNYNGKYYFFRGFYISFSSQAKASNHRCRKKGDSRL